MGGAGGAGGASDVPDTLTVDVRTEESEVRLVVDGRLDGVTRAVLFESVWSVVRERGDFVIDLRGVTSADVAGVQGLVELWRIGVVDRFDHVPPAVRDVMGKEPPEPFAR